MTAAFEPTQQSAERQAAALELEWSANPLWEGVTGDYSATDVIRLRGRVSEEYTLARRGSNASTETGSRTPAPSSKKSPGPKNSPTFLTIPACARFLTEAREKATAEELAAS